MTPTQVQRLLDRLREYDERLSSYYDGPQDDEEYDRFADWIEENFDTFTNRHYSDYDDIFGEVKELIEEYG